MTKYFAIKEAAKNVWYVGKNGGYTDLAHALLFDTFENAEKHRSLCTAEGEEITVPIHVAVTMQEGENFAVTSPGNLSFY